MVAQDYPALYAQWKQSERAMAMILEMDHIRDEHAHQPSQMLAGLLAVVGQALSADAGLLALADGLDQLKVGAMFDPHELLAQLDQDALDQVIHQAFALQSATLSEAGRGWEQIGVTQVLAAPVNAEGKRMGCLVMASREQRFDDNGTGLLQKAISQIDSAVIQARTWLQLLDRRRQLEERNRQLDAIYRIDRARDQTTDVNRLVGQIANVLTDVLDLDLCMVGLVEAEQEEIVLKAFTDRAKILPRVAKEDIQRALAAALAANAPCTLASPEPFVGLQLDQCLVAPLVIEGVSLGALVLMRRKNGFAIADTDLVDAIVSQADSAVEHLRTFQQAQERARQLEAIHRVDRIRDEARNAQEIFPAIVDLIIGLLDADLCMLSLVSADTEQNEIKSIEDRNGVFGRLDRDAVQRVIEWAASQRQAAVLTAGSPLEKWGFYNVMGAPLRIAGELLGTLVLANQHKAFGPAERGLFEAIVGQTDSAVVHARAESRLRQRHKELETLYRVDQIRDQGYEFGEMLSLVLGELCQAIDAEMGFIMLFDREGQQLELKASTDDDILASAGHFDLIEQAASKALSSGELYVTEHSSDWLHAIMCVPLILRDRIIGVFGAINHRGPGGFADEDKRMLLAITSQVDTAIFESLDKQRIRETFQRYVGPNVMEQMLATPEKDFLKGDRSLLTVLFSDMRGFTRMSEQVGVDILVEMINMHLGAMTQTVLHHSGTLDKFVADEVMAIFGAPLSMEDHALRAIHTALEMQAAQEELVARWKTRGYGLPPIGIGINTGEMIVGNIGCEQQMDYTVIGDAVNLASRLCDAAPGGQILITEATYQLAKQYIAVTKLPEIYVKGKEDPVQVYQVLGLV